MTNKDKDFYNSKKSTPEENVYQNKLEKILHYLNFKNNLSNYSTKRVV